MVRGGICPPVENVNVEGSKNRCLMQEQCFSILLSKYVFGFRGFAPDLCRSSILRPPVVRRPLSLLPLRGEYPAGAQAW